MPKRTGASLILPDHRDAITDIGVVERFVSRSDLRTVGSRRTVMRGSDAGTG
jgi:hypothetical protein